MDEFPLWHPSLSRGMLEGGSATLLLIQVHVVLCSCFVDFTQLICLSSCCDVKVLASSAANELLIGAIVPAGVLILSLHEC